MTDEARQIPADWIGSWPGSLAYLAARGLPFATFIDLGCAEGYHALAAWHAGLLRGKTIINVDANPVFEPLLKKIHAAIGGHYRICAIAEHSGTIDLYSSAHPYWSSAAEPGDSYWDSVNQQLGERKRVPCRTLDSLIDELKPATPYVLKLDLQGFEARALRSGARMLKDTALVVCEIVPPAFREVDSTLEAAGFDLFDVANLHRAEDSRLGWFDAVYLQRGYAGLRPASIWPSEQNEDVAQKQLEREKSVRGWIDAILSLTHSGR